MHWDNQREKEAEKNGYIIMSWYDTKDEIDHVISQIHGCGIRAMKAHHHDHREGAEYDFWVLWVKKEDLVKLSPDYKPPAKKEKPKPKKGGIRKDTAIRVISMRKSGMEWEDIAKQLDRTVNTVKDYYYRYNCKGKTALTDWKNDERPEGYVDPRTSESLRTSEN